MFCWRSAYTRKTKATTVFGWEFSGQNILLPQQLNKTITKTRIRSEDDVLNRTTTTTTLSKNFNLKWTNMAHKLMKPCLEKIDKIQRLQQQLGRSDLNKHQGSRLAWMVLENSHHNHQLQRPISYWINWTGKHATPPPPPPSPLSDSNPTSPAIEDLESVYSASESRILTLIYGRGIPGRCFACGHRSSYAGKQSRRRRRSIINDINLIINDHNFNINNHNQHYHHHSFKNMISVLSGFGMQKPFIQKMMMSTFNNGSNNSGGGHSDLDSGNHSDNCSNNNNNDDSDAITSNINILVDDYDGDDPIKHCWKCDKPLKGVPSQSPNTNGCSEQNSEDSGNVGTATSHTKITIFCPNCHSIQPLAKDVDYFHLFQMYNQQSFEPENGTNTATNRTSIEKKKQLTASNGNKNENIIMFNIDLNELHQNYLRLQQNMHPDMNINRSNIEAGYSSDNASIINDGYKILRDPYQRALYMLKRIYNIHIDEVNVDTEPELLLEMMELNEEIEMAKGDKPSLDALTEQVKEQIELIVEQIKQAFDQDHNGSEARRLTIRYSYYRSILDKLKSKS